MQHFSKHISAFISSGLCIMFMLPVFIPANSKADEFSIGHFTNSLTKVYSISKSCQHTIEPGPKEYMELITTYFIKLYPNGTSYWIVPDTVKMIPDAATCIRLMHSKLNEYRNARTGYRNNYPDRNPPPVLIAYQWWEKDFEEPINDTPSKSYIPASKASKIKQKFASSLQ